MNVFSKDLVRNSLNNPLITGSSVLFVGTMIANFGSYLYHLLMGRMLGPNDYGILTSLIALVYLFSIISATFLTTIVKFVTKYKAEREFKKIFSLFWQLQKIFGLTSLFLFGLLFFLKGSMASFLHFKNSFPVVILAAWVGISLLSFVNEGILRGFLRFNFLSFNAVFATGLKLVLAILLVKVGFGVSGALGGIVLSSLVYYLLSFYPLRFLWQYEDGEKIDWGAFFSYSAPVLLATLGLTSLYSSDVILVKHLFPSYEAGLYSATSVLGRIIFFASGVVPAVMFPLVSERYENGQTHRYLLKQSLLIVGGISLLLTLVYFLAPQLMIKLLYGDLYLSASSYLGIFAVFISLYSLSNLLVSYFLSIRQTQVAFLILTAAVIQAILIYFFHRSLFQVIEISILVAGLILFSLLVYYNQNEKNK